MFHAAAAGFYLEKVLQKCLAGTAESLTNLSSHIQVFSITLFASSLVMPY